MAREKDAGRAEFASADCGHFDLARRWFGDPDDGFLTRGNRLMSRERLEYLIMIVTLAVMAGRLAGNDVVKGAQLRLDWGGRCAIRAPSLCPALRIDHGCSTAVGHGKQIGTGRKSALIQGRVTNTLFFKYLFSCKNIWFFFLHILYILSIDKTILKPDLHQETLEIAEARKILNIYVD